MNGIVLKSRSRSRRWLFRLLAIVCGLLPFVVLEFSLSIADVGRRDATDDPFVGFAEIVPLFELSEDGTKYEIAERRRKFFAHDEFPVEKGPDTFRIFCLGGSTVQGRPYSIQTSFTTFLRIALEEADPKRNWEVVNCGGISYASYRLVPILKECLNYEPDLFIICTGHNEFLEDRSYGHIKARPTWIHQPTTWLMNSRTVTVASQLFGEQQLHAKEVLPTDADAMLDYRDGIDAFHRDEAWNAAVAMHFKSNLQRMVEIARGANVSVLVMQPPSNLSGIAPFKSVPSDGLDSSQISNLEGEKERARDLYKSDLNAAIKVWQEIVKTDPASAKNWFELGRCLEIQRREIEARTAYIEARDRDVCPLRMTTPLEHALHQVAAENDVPLLNLHELLEQQTSNGILGDNWLVDHVHPNFEGHYEIALAIATWMNETSMVRIEHPQAWESASRKSFAQHLDALDRAYFHLGERALESLRGWTQGDRDGKPVQERFPHRFQNKQTETSQTGAP